MRKEGEIYPVLIGCEFGLSQDQRDETWKRSSRHNLVILLVYTCESLLFPHGNLQQKCWNITCWDFRKKKKKVMKIFPRLRQTDTHTHTYIYLCLSSQFGCTAVIECAHKINTAGNDIPSPASSPVSFLTLLSLTFSSLQSIFLYECTQLGYDLVDFMSYIIVWWGKKRLFMTL